MQSTSHKNAEQGKSDVCDLTLDIDELAGTVSVLSEWLINSELQQKTGMDKGGIHAWIDLESNIPTYLYTEATGYFISLVSNMDSFDHRLVWHEMARAAGDWIIDMALHKKGLLLARKYASTGNSADPFCFSNNWAVHFDNCMAAYGLLNLYRMSGDKKYLDEAVSIANACINAFFSAELHLLHPILDITTGRLAATSDHWSRHGGSFHLKCALLYSSLYVIIRDPRYPKVVDNLTQMALATQQADGGFITSPAEGSTHLHPHNYTVEGLLFLAHQSGRQNLLDHASRGIDFAFRHCLDLEQGLFHTRPRLASYCAASFRSDAFAQSLRCYYLAKLINPETTWDWEHRIPQLQSELDSFSLPDGGTSYGRDSNGDLIPHSNSWCHFFRTEASLFRYRYEAGLGIPESGLIIT